MKITPAAGPSITMNTTQPSNGGSDYAARAIEAFNKASQPAQSVVQNQNSVQPEEMGAIRQSSTTEDSQVEETIQEVEAKEVETTEDPQLSSKFAQLAKREKQIRIKAQQQEQAIKTRQSQIDAEVEAKVQERLKARETEYISKARLKSQTLDVLAEEGLSYDELTQQIIQQQSLDPATRAYMAKLEAKLARLEEANTAGQKSVVEQQQQQYQAAVQQITKDVRNLVNTDPAFETTKTTDSVRDVVELIERNFKKTGEVMSVEDAAEQVENYLIDEVLKLTRIEKIKKRMNSASTTEASSQMQTPKSQKQQQPMKTLTNAVSSTRQLSAKERALLAFKGELNKA